MTECERIKNLLVDLKFIKDMEDTWSWTELAINRLPWHVRGHLGLKLMDCGHKLPTYVEDAINLLWINNLPSPSQVLAKRFPPNKDYLILGGNCPAHIVSYSNNGTMAVIIDDPEFPRKVFGLKPEDLKPYEG